MFFLKIVQHPGGLPGFVAQVAFRPSENFGFAIMINSEALADVATALATKIMEAAFSLPSGAPVVQDGYVVVSDSDLKPRTVIQG